MADNTGFKLFGFEIKRSKKEEPIQSASVVPPTDDDGAGYVTAPAHHYGTYLELDGGLNAKDNLQLIQEYRRAAKYPETDLAIDEIVNESIVVSDDRKIVSVNTDNLEASTKIKNMISDEFDNICKMLNFNELAHDIFRSWYVDGRLYHHLIIDESNPKAGIIEIRYIDSIKIRKVKQVKYKKDEKTGAKLVDKVDEFYLFQDNIKNASSATKLSNDSVSYVTSGLLDESRKRVVSHLHKAIKPINQLRTMEDSLVVYRLSRAPERRIFYIDVGNLQTSKAEQYLKSVMSKYRNKLVYDANTGKIKDDRKHMSMIEDFWLPRKEGGRGTEISTLPGGQNLGEIDDIRYFQRKVYQSLNVPVSRIEQEQAYSLGRATEINREEIKFQKFISRLRLRFSRLFTEILKKQLILKGVLTEKDWNDYRHSIFIDFQKDNHYYELKDAEVFRERMQNMDQVSQYVGEYFSKDWVRKNVLKLSDEEISEIEKQMKKDAAEEPPPEEEEQPQQQQRESFEENLDNQYAMANLELMETVTNYLKSED